MRGSALGRLLRTTDAKQIGLLYLTTSFGFFLAGGLMAMLMRGELARPGLQFLSPEQYTEVIPVFSRKPLFCYKGMVAATVVIFAYSMIVWAHHMYPPASCCCHSSPRQRSSSPYPQV
ncbi:hypothetical protein Phou_079640 [Phytohabitans houttuyneae]|uniref:Cytochrome oxidase subunit I profile domain-containing protein n=1 Tax=Phytohabitans houttuyneae TaxID=1076126 RepID=A0A6V8KIX2_9ACTN|nr:hypothetical protein Phou_079640 [Phytohabitans houttuyneae]